MANIPRSPAALRLPRPHRDSSAAPLAPPVDRRSPVPLHWQIKRFIEQQLDSGAWSDEEPVPSERDLCAQLRVSRPTVREAFRHLVADGRLVQLSGKGTYATAFRRRTVSLAAFGDDAVGSWRDRLLSFKAVRPGPDVARALRLGAGERVVLLRRLRGSETGPTAVDALSVPTRILATSRDGRSEDPPLERLLERRYGIAPARVLQDLRVVRSSASVGRLLGVDPGSPLFLIRRTSFDVHGRPFEHLQSLLRGDRYLVQAELRETR